MIKLKILEKICNDKVLIAKVAESRDVDFQTAERWFKTNDEKLLHIGTLKNISEHLKSPIDSLYELKK